MIRALFCVTLITVLVVYVPDSTKQELKRSITSAYGSLYNVVEKIFPNGPNTLRHIFSRTIYVDTHNPDPFPEHTQVEEDLKRACKKEEHTATMSVEIPSVDQKHFYALYKKNRDKVIELMNLLEEPLNDTNK